MRNLIFPASIVLLLSSCHPKDTSVKETAPFSLNQELKSKISIKTLSKQPISEPLTLTGNITYNSDKLIQYVSLYSGVITNSYFSLGDYVKKGQVLAEMKSTELNELQSQKKTLESQLLVAQNALSATQTMFHDGIASQKELITAQSEVNATKASLQNIIANLSLFSADTQRGVIQIKSPANGYIVTKNLSNGMQINSSDETLFTISDLSEVWVMINIYAGNMQHIKEGMEVKIKTLSYPDTVFNGKITALSKVFDSEEHVLKARVVMQNKDLKLKPGMSADIIAHKASQQTAIAVPKNAVIFDNNQHYIVLYTNDSKIETIPIKPITKNEDWVFIDQNELEGKKIITNNHLLIYEQIKNDAIN
ncbi:efflux RND transporter periplasmic adaptor subunit [Flavobacterium sp. ZT3R18]|uniref:efflux RND transporter periplasmic adaptor subunit n=1 Tax=Flavobacterium sp. ZT3R18 TaxID=2594429 RepID=UPI00117B3A22|nr:efflux RND transporter periplasmic adaptor subunit [Flavobacterium sp. ZT3R18]TRX35176.1 efflux RND transporter periplasmic adaptor subunit [Flavobacterium sp. ZT3R18]